MAPTMKTRGKVLTTTYPASPAVKQAIKPNDEFEAVFYSDLTSSGDEAASDYHDDMRKRRRVSKAKDKNKRHKRVKKGRSTYEKGLEPVVTMQPANWHGMLNNNEDASNTEDTTNLTGSTIKVEHTLVTPSGRKLVSVDVPPSPLRLGTAANTFGSQPAPPQIVHFSIANLNHQARQHGYDASADFVGVVQQDNTIKITDATHENGLSAHLSSPKLDGLPNELIQAICQNLFVSTEPIDFNKREDLDRSAALLRTCKKIHSLGTEVLYGENAFHFERRNSTRGEYYDKIWKEIGYMDVWRFLKAIGPCNIAHLKYISIEFTDAIASLTTYMEEPERKFTNDGNLMDVFKMLAAGGTLEKFAISFHSRRNIDCTDYWFLKNLSQIKCYNLLLFSKYRAVPLKLAYGVNAKLRKLMVVKRKEEINENKKIVPVMVQDVFPATLFLAQ